jgi:hypothetical protein
MTLVNRIIGAVTLNKDALKDIAKSDDATGQAWLLIFASSIIYAIGGGLAYFLTGEAAYLGNASLFVSGLGDAEGIAILIAGLLIGFLFQFLYVVLIGACLGFSGRGFGGDISTTGVIRIMGFAGVLSIIDAVVVLLAALLDMSVLTNITLITAIWTLVILVVGYSTGAEIGIVSAIIAIIIALILAVIILFILFLILGIILLAALFSTLTVIIAL